MERRRSRFSRGIGDGGREGAGEGGRGDMAWVVRVGAKVGLVIVVVGEGEELGAGLRVVTAGA